MRPAARLAALVAPVVALAVPIVAAACTASCAAAPPDAHPEPPIASAWRARCGACHMRVEPGTHGRAALEAAMRRHRKRTRLSDTQARQLVDFLSRDR